MGATETEVGKYRLLVKSSAQPASMHTFTGLSQDPHFHIARDYFLTQSQGTEGAEDTDLQTITI